MPAASADLGNEGYGIAVKDDALFLWGGSTRGAINAVYALIKLLSRLYPDLFF